MKALVCRAAAAAAILLLAGGAMAQEKSKARTLNVKVKYTGEGKVDDKHRIAVFVFDSPDFTQGSVAPFATKDTDAKEATVTFSDLDRSPVYVAVIFSPDGTYDGSAGPPPSGSSIGMYSTEPPQPSAINIEEGKSADIDLPFDDSFKMP